ncbi:hypothetical protein ACX1C1_10545 [Paenibacillus sp. strain BS8-2]
MGKALKRLMGLLLLLLLLIAGGLWWLLSYIAPDEKLDLSYQNIDVRQKATDMVKQLKPELVLTEVDINNLIKKNLDPNINDHVVVDGASFDLDGDRLVANMNITYRDLVPMAVRAEYQLEWQDPNLALRPQSLKVKGIELPLDMLDTYVFDLDLPTGDLVQVSEVRFQGESVTVKFKLSMPF